MIPYIYRPTEHFNYIQGNPGNFRYLGEVRVCEIVGLLYLSGTKKFWTASSALNFLFRRKLALWERLVPGLRLLICKIKFSYTDKADIRRYFMLVVASLFVC